jgi:hypothetical protein
MYIIVTINGFLSFSHHPVFRTDYDVPEIGSFAVLRWKVGEYPSFESFRKT